MMRKHATLNSVQDNGTYPNPVSVLYNEEIEYKITTLNLNQQAGDVIITDTLPPYLNYVSGSTTGASINTTSGPPSRPFSSGR